MATTLAGKVAVVTGASRGIGKQTSLALAELGASVVLASRTEEPRRERRARCTRPPTRSEPRVATRSS